MIKLFIYCLLGLGVGAYLSIKLAEDPGYVLVSFQGYSLEATLVTSLLAIGIIFFLVFGLWWLVKAVNPFKLLKKSTWSAIFRIGSSKMATEKGLRLLLLGHWQASYKLLVENAGRAPMPVFNYLAASLAAFQRGDKLAWVYCLDQAIKINDSTAGGVKNLKALLELKDGRFEQSLLILLQLKKENPDSPYILVLIKEVYVALEDWVKLELILPELEKHKLLEESELKSLFEKVAMFHLGNISEAESEKVALNLAWKNIPKQIKNSEAVVICYVRKLLELGSDEEALIVLSRYLKQNWSDGLVDLLGRVESKEVGKKLLILEGWVKDRPKNVVLMLALGRLSMRNQLWGKAREYFEAASKISEDGLLRAEINAELARLLENMGEHEKSLESYNKAMELLGKKLPDLPMPIKVK